MTRFWNSRALGLVLLLGGLGAACGRTKPSEVPLGGEEEPKSRAGESEAREVSAGAAREPSQEEELEPVEEDEEEEPDDDEEEIFIEDDDDEGDDDEGELDETSQRSERGAKVSALSAPPAAPPVPPPCAESAPVLFSCRPLSDKCPALRALCQPLEALLQPKVANAVVECVARDECRFDDHACLRDATRLACVDEPARAFCKDRFEACGESLGEFTREDCEYGVSSLLPEPRRRFVACMANSCDARECLLRVLPPPG